MTSPFIHKSEAGRDLHSVIITTPRLTLLPINQEFAASIFKEFTAEITRYMLPNSPDSIDETRAFIDDAIHQRGEGTDIVLVILDSDSKRFLGVCGLHSRSNPREPELGIWLAKSAHGQRYGREAIRGVCDWAMAHLELDAFIYPVDRNNLPSRKIPESMGGVIFKEMIVPTMSGGVLDEVVYRLPARI